MKAGHNRCLMRSVGGRVFWLEWIPACAGVQHVWIPACAGVQYAWIPAFAGMTDENAAAT
jgi:hypothetical protein